MASKKTRDFALGFAIVADNFISEIITFHIHWNGYFVHDPYKMLDSVKVTREEPTAH